MKRALRMVIVGAMGLLAATSAVHANAYKILCVRSAKATAMGDAFIAQADDPSAVTFNPAGLPQIEGTQVSLQGTLCNSYIEHEAPSGDKTDNEDAWQFIPSLFVATDFGSDKIGGGLGVSLPNGMSSEWSDDSFARYVSTYSDLTVADISPAFGARIGNRLLIGGAADFYYSEAELRNMADLGLASGAPGMMDTESKLEGDGTAWGFNVGAIYMISSRHSVAATYRHPYEVEYDGDLTFGGTRSDVEATFGFPAVVVVGYAFRPTEKWKIEFNADWTHWSAVDDIEVDVDSPVLPDQRLEQDLENTMAYKLGAEYAFSDNLDLRCGYIYNENATPEKTFRPSLPDTDIHFLTAGFGYTVNNITFDTALQLVFYETRTIDNNVDLNETTSSSSVDGTYRTFAPCLSVAATYRF